MIPRRLPAAFLSFLIAGAVTPLNAEEARPAIKAEESTGSPETGRHLPRFR